MIQAVATIALVVAPLSAGQTTKPITAPRVKAIAVTVNGRDAAYERVTPCVAFIYGSGIVAKLDACKKNSWTLSSYNLTRAKRTVRVEVR